MTDGDLEQFEREAMTGDASRDRAVFMVAEEARRARESEARLAQAVSAALGVLESATKMSDDHRIGTAILCLRSSP